MARHPRREGEGMSIWTILALICIALFVGTVIGVLDAVLSDRWEE